MLTLRLTSLLLGAVLLTVACSGGGLHPSPPPAPPPGCGPDPFAHVYNPKRLTILDDCIEVSGTVVRIRTEADGDLHIRVNVDDASLLNSFNVREQGGSLVVEPICVGKVSQEDAKAACEGFHNTMPIPRVGMRIRMMGPWVTDTQHGWNELHPLISWEEIR